MKKITIFLLLLFVFNFANIQKVFGASSYECLTLTVNLRQGVRDSASDSVTSLQSFLRAGGYLTVNSTGYFGVQTLRAVKDFQKDNNITPTGFVGPVTRSMIQKISCPALTVTEPETTNTNNPTPPVPATPPAVVENVPVPITPVPVVSNELLPAPTASSLRVRTDSVVSVSKDSLLVRGTVTAGARSATESWFELTTNPDVYKVSESTVSAKVPQKTNTKFEYLFSGLKAGTVYYFRACAGNTSLGQKSCGVTVSVTTSNI